MTSDHEESAKSAFCVSTALKIAAVARVHHNNQKKDGEKPAVSLAHRKSSLPLPGIPTTVLCTANVVTKAGCNIRDGLVFATDDFAAEKRSGTAQKLYLVRDAGFDVPLKSSRDCAQGSSEANDRSDVHCEQEEDILFSSKNVQQQIKEKHNQVDMITRMKNHIIEVMKIVPNGSLTCQWNHSEHWKPNDGLHMLDAGGEGQFPANFKKGLLTRFWRM